MREISSFDYFVKKLYKPKENIEHIYELTALALIMSSNDRLAQQLRKNHFLSVPLIKDVKYLLGQVARIDPEFLRLAARFCSYTLRFKGRDMFN